MADDRWRPAPIEERLTVPSPIEHQRAIDQLLAYYRSSRPRSYVAWAVRVLLGVLVFVIFLGASPTLRSEPAGVVLGAVLTGTLVGFFGSYIVNSVRRNRANPFGIPLNRDTDASVEVVIRCLVSIGNPGPMTTITRRTVSDAAVLALAVAVIRASGRITGHPAVHSPLLRLPLPMRDGYPVAIDLIQRSFQLCAIVHNAAGHNQQYAANRLGEAMSGLWNAMDALRAYADNLDGILIVQDRVLAISTRPALDDQIDRLTGQLRGAQDVQAAQLQWALNAELQERVAALNFAANQLSGVAGTPDLYRHF